MHNYRFGNRLIASAMAALMLVSSTSALAYATRGTTRTSVNSTSVNRSASVNSASVNRSASASSASVNRSASVNSASVNTANVNRNVNVNSTTVNVNRNVNVNTGCCYNNVGTAGAVRYRLPPTMEKARQAKTDVYGYMLGTVSLDQLRVFIAAAEEGSFSAAGRRLRRAQSLVSQAISNLEGQLNVKLFDRA